jgi:hypothetical protein
MGITDKDGLWDVRPSEGTIRNCKTGEVKRVENLPSANAIAYANYNVYMRKCAAAFATGSWPMTEKTCGYCRQKRYESF